MAEPSIAGFRIPSVSRSKLGYIKMREDSTLLCRYVVSQPYISAEVNVWHATGLYEKLYEMHILFWFRGRFSRRVVPQSWKSIEI